MSRFRSRGPVRGATPSLSPAALLWALENLARGASATEVSGALRAANVPPAVIARGLRELARSPLARPTTDLLRARARTGELLELLLGLRRRDPLEVVHELPPAPVFFARYWATNTPVVVRGFLSSWAVPFRPTWEELRADYGEVTVSVTEGRSRYENPGLHFQDQVRSMRFGAFLDRVLGSPTNDVYMVARNDALGGPLAQLMKSIEPPTEWFDPSLRGVSLWLGPAGTLTRLHHDGTNNLFCQVLGRKSIKLISPLALEIGETAEGYYAWARPDEFESEVHEVTLEEGDAVFLPVGWWHEVASLSPSLSLALVGFNRPNGFDYRAGRSPAAPPRG